MENFISGMGGNYIRLSHSLHILGSLLPPLCNFLVAVETLCLVGNKLLKQNFK